MAKFGEGHVAAMGRLGLQELRNAMNPSRESVAGSEIGVFGTATQAEITNSRRADGPEKDSLSMDDLRSAAQEKARENERGKDGPEQDRGLEL